ncbi:MAG: CYTH domain-containing protein [Oscillospiraceae bacterium]
MSTVEIERKWLMADFPPISWNREEHMEQGYISFSPAVRIRKTVKEEKTDYWLTIKGKGTLSRTEVETPITQEQYEALLPLLAAPPATKSCGVTNCPKGWNWSAALLTRGRPVRFTMPK